MVGETSRTSPLTISTLESMSRHSTILILGATLWAAALCAGQPCMVPVINLESGSVSREPTTCQRGSTCIRGTTIGQLTFFPSTTNPAFPDSKLLKFSGADYCKCVPGTWGLACQYTCPQDGNCMEQHVHAPLVRHAEKCGQSFYEVDAFPSNASWPLAGLCNCRLGYTGDGCQFVIHTGAVAPSQVMARMHADLLQSQEYLVPTAILQPKTQTAARSIQTLCGKHGRLSMATGECQCEPGWASSVSRSLHKSDMVQPLGPPAAAPQTSSNAWHNPEPGVDEQGRIQVPAWSQAQQPLCSIQLAKFKSLDLVPGSGSSDGMAKTVAELLAVLNRHPNAQLGSTTAKECIGLLTLQPDPADVADCKQFVHALQQQEARHPGGLLDDEALARSAPFGQGRDGLSSSSDGGSSSFSTTSIVIIVVMCVLAFALLVTTICCFCPPPGYRSPCSIYDDDRRSAKRNGRFDEERLYDM